MSVLVTIPGPLRELAGNLDEVRLEQPDGPLSATLARLWRVCPAIRDRVLTERGEVRPHVNIFVDGENIRFAKGFDTQVRDGAEVMLVGAVSGG